jgi:hypothetical protein
VVEEEKKKTVLGLLSVGENKETRAMRERFPSTRVVGDGESQAQVITTAL